MRQADIDRTQEFRKCIECWLCQDVCHVIRDHEENKPSYAGPRYFIWHAELDMHPLDAGDRRSVLRERQGLGMCNITKCCTEVCPAGIKITDNAIIPMKERSADQRYDPLGRVLRSWRGRAGRTPRLTVMLRPLPEMQGQNARGGAGRRRNAPGDEERNIAAMRVDYHEQFSAGANAMVELERAVRGSTLEPALLELVRIRASQINGCTYCLAMHNRDARARGEHQTRLDTVAAWREAPFYTARERAALAWCEALTELPRTGAPDDVYAAVEAVFSAGEVAALTFAIAAINGWNRLAVGLRSDVMSLDGLGLPGEAGGFPGPGGAA
jgi:AhpD family alkylhydroperoxidase